MILVNLFNMTRLNKNTFRKSKADNIGDIIMQEETKAQTCCEFSESTTIHGLNKTCNIVSHKAKRLVWLVLLLAMLGLYFYIAVSSIIAYLSWESVTKMTKTTKSELEFPSVSICFQDLFQRWMLDGDTEAEFWVRHLETHSFWDLTEDDQANATRALDMPLFSESLNRIDPHSILERCEFNSEVFECSERFIWQNAESNSCATFMDPESRKRYGSPMIRSPGFPFGLSECFLDSNYHIFAS